MSPFLQEQDLFLIVSCIFWLFIQNWPKDCKSLILYFSMNVALRIDKLINVQCLFSIYKILFSYFVIIWICEFGNFLGNTLPRYYFSYLVNHSLSSGITYSDNIIFNYKCKCFKILIFFFNYNYNLLIFIHRLNFLCLDWMSVNDYLLVLRYIFLIC